MKEETLIENTLPVQGNLPKAEKEIISRNYLWKILIAAILILLVVGGSVYAGIKIGRNQEKSKGGQQVIPTPQTSITSKANLPFPITRNNQNFDYTNWATYKDKSGYSIRYPVGWYVTDGGQQVESFDPNNINIPLGLPISGNNAKWDLYFGEKDFNSFEEAILQADQSVKNWDVVEVSSTVAGWPVYFAYKENLEPFGGPYLVAVIFNPDNKTITWHGFSGDTKSPNIEKLKQIAESIQKTTIE